MAEENTADVSKQGHQIQVPSFGNAFFVPVIVDPTSGMPVIPLYPTQMNDPADENSQGGLFAVPMFVTGAMDPVPLSYNAPLGNNPQANAADAEDAARRPERQVVRRFRVGIQLDLLLIMKLATMVFIFSQDGSRDKLLLLFLAGMVYLYQTGALTPLIRWASERARRAMMPPMQIANVPPPQDVPEDNNTPAAGPVEAPQETPQAQEHDLIAGEDEHQNLIQPPPQQVLQEAGFFREVQMFVIGLLTSLLPGFHNVD